MNSVYRINKIFVQDKACEMNQSPWFTNGKKDYLINI